MADQLGGNAESLRHLIQTDAAINPGNSGDAAGIGFALPVDLAKPIIAQVLAGKPIERPYIGIRYRDLDAQIAEDNDLSVTLGAWVHVEAGGDTAVLADSPATDAGLEDGDIITAIDGQAVDREHPLDLLLRHAPGDNVDMTVLRGEQTITVALTLGTRPAAD